MSKMDAKQIAEALEEIGLLLELKGENPFKVRAYVNAAHTLNSQETEWEEFLVEIEAGNVKGIGAALTEKILALAQEGSLPYLDELRAEFPDKLLTLLAIPGLGAKKVKVLYEELGIASLGELEYACHENRLVELKGFGAKTQANILAGIERIASYSGRFRRDIAKRTVQKLVEILEATGVAGRIEPAGSFRRQLETVKDVDLLATSDKPGILMEAFVSHPEVQTITGRGPTKSSIVMKDGIAADLRVVPEESFAPALVHFTGSKEHNTVLRGLCKKLGYKLNEYGLYKDDQPLPAKTEEDLYAHLGLSWIPPELREDRSEIKQATAGPFPKLVEERDLRGVMHVHSTFSDGSLTVKQIAQAVQKRGYEYLGLTDHSQTAAYAGGLKLDDIKRQHEQIDKLNEELAPFRIFKGIESDILTDGSLDYPDQVLATFDFVIASVHSGFTLTEKAMTERIVRAVENPYTTILGHPTGRLLLSREGYALDLMAVIEAAGKAKVAIEINANPHRLDLDWRYHQRAAGLGISLPICPDAHDDKGIDHLSYGVGVARKGGLTAADVLNCLPVAEIADYFEGRKP